MGNKTGGNAKGKCVCVFCGRSARSKECGFCRAARKANEKVLTECRVCGKTIHVAKRYIGDYRRRGSKPICASCRDEESSIRIVTATKAMTERDKARRNEKASRSLKNKKGSHVKKQWDTIRHDHAMMKRVSKKRSLSMKKVWDEMPEGEKNRRIEAWFSSHGKSRSKGNDRLKQMMIAEGIYDGFLSEQVFHGYIPDEINHELRIIVEYFGDIYHCNPRMYRDGSEYIELIKRTVGEQWERDRKRFLTFYRYGYSVIVVWAKDFRDKSRREIERVKDEIVEKRKSARVV